MNLIAVWGSSGAGKTTTALALASVLAQQKRDVLLLSADTRTPMLPVLLPLRSDLDARNSIGPLLSADKVTESMLKDRLLEHPRSRHIYFAGLCSGEAAAIT